MTVTGKGAYKGSVSKTFKITPRKPYIYGISSPKTRRIKVSLYSAEGKVFDSVYASLLKSGGADAVQIVYSTSSKFTKSTTKAVNTKKSAKTITGLKKGKTYYVKVRSYKTINGKRHYSEYSTVHKIKVK
jgi:hypothetical protein